MESGPQPPSARTPETESQAPPPLPVGSAEGNGAEDEAGAAAPGVDGTGVMTLHVASPSGEVVTLDGISAGECVLALRTALAEHPATAAFTAYNLILDQKENHPVDQKGHQSLAPPAARLDGPASASASAAAEAAAEQDMVDLIHVRADGSVELSDVLEVAEYGVVGLGDG